MGNDERDRRKPTGSELQGRRRLNPFPASFEVAPMHTTERVGGSMNFLCFAIHRLGYSALHYASSLLLGVDASSTCSIENAFKSTGIFSRAMAYCAWSAVSSSRPEICGRRIEWPT